MMKQLQKIFLGLIISLGATSVLAQGNSGILSMGSLEFNPDGILFIGDSKGGAVYAFDLNESSVNVDDKNVRIADLEGKIAALLGTTKEEILIHDMAVNPVSHNIFLSVSRGRGKWTSQWHLPNDLMDASILLRIDPEGNMEEASLENIDYSKVELPNPVDESKTHKWKEGIQLRVDAITQIVYNNGIVYVAGLSNEEFASTMWVAPYPFKDNITATTLEIYHGAHGEYETHAPIRTFLPYTINQQAHLLAAYLCTPLVTFPTAQLENKKHIKGRTVAEFGSGNYPLDMLLYQNQGKDLILMSNSQLPLLIFDPKDVEAYQGEITEEVKGYMAGVKYTPRSGSGIQQLDDFNNKFILATQRMASGSMYLISLPKEWLMQ
ncbi:MAG: hypothetical protein O6848_02860 [Bacteroidetes bacterium]|nr:hypothetical protein [Bacteroidota bacterium]